MKRIIISIAAVLFLSKGFAQVPGTLSYQGILVTGAGAPVSDGNHTVVFNFYTAATGGVPVFARGQFTVTTYKGMFTLVLGTGVPDNTVNAPLPVLATDPNYIGGSQYYVELVADNVILAPRVQLSSVPYAFNAQNANTITGTVAGSQISTGINAANVTTGTMSGNRISGGTVTAALSGNAATASKLTVTTGSPAQICCGGDVTLSDGSGYMYTGDVNGENMVFDNNEIQARNNGAASTLFFNYGGGNITMGSSGTSISVSVNGSVVHSSDARLKSNILGLNYGLKEILLLKPVSYRWKKTPEAGTQLGFIAQEVKPVIGELVQEGINKDDMLSVNYIGLIPVLIKAIQEQQVQIEELKMENTSIKAELVQVKAKLNQYERLSAQVDELKRLMTEKDTSTPVRSGGNKK